MAKFDTKLLEMLLKAGKITQKTFDDAVKMAEKGVQDPIQPKKILNAYGTGATPLREVQEIAGNIRKSKTAADKLSEPTTYSEKIMTRYQGHDDADAIAQSLAKVKQQDLPYVHYGRDPIPVGNEGFQIFEGQEIGRPGISMPYHNEAFPEVIPWMDTKFQLMKNAMAKARDEGVPYIINTSSDLVGRDDYIEALGKNAKVKIWALPDAPIGSETGDAIRHLFPGNPSRLRQKWAFDKLKQAGVDVEWIEPTPEIVRQTIKNKTKTNALKFGPGSESADDELLAIVDEAIKSPRPGSTPMQAIDGAAQGSGKPKGGLIPVSGAAAMSSNFENPLNLLQPAVDAYEGAKNKISGTLAGQMDLTKDKSATPGIQETLNVVADPLNLLPGAAGVGAAAIQGMSQMTPKAPVPPFPMQAVEGLYKGGMIRPEVFQAYQKRFQPQGFADGGVIPGLVPDVGSMPIPTTDQITADLTAQGRMPVPEAKADLLTGLDDVYNQQRAAMPGMNFPQDQTVTGQTPAPPQPEGNFVNMVPKGQNADPAAMMKQMSAGIDPAFAAYEKALGLEGQAAMGQANAMTDYAKSAAQTIQDEQVKLEQMQAAQRLEWDKQVQKINEATQDYQNFKVDPNRIWANKSTGQKLGIAISLFFAGINGSDAGMQIINSAIDRDIEAQKAMMNAKREKIGFERGILSDMMARFGDERTAVQAAKVSALSIAELQLKAQTARMQGTAAHAQGLKGLAELQLKKAEAMQKLKDAYILSPQYAKADQLTQKILQLPKDLQAKAWGEKASYDGIQTALKELDQVYGSAPYLSGKVPFTNAWKARDINAAKMFTLVKNIVGEKMSEGDKDLIDPFVPEDTDTPGQRAQKRNDFRAWLTNRVSERTPILTGLGAIPRMSLTFDERPAE